MWQYFVWGMIWYVSNVRLRLFLRQRLVVWSCGLCRDSVTKKYILQQCFHLLRLCISDRWMNEYGAWVEWYWWENWSTWRENATFATSSTTNIACIGLGSNPGFHREMLAIDRLSQGVAHTIGTALAATARGEKMWEINNGRKWAGTSWQTGCSVSCKLSQRVVMEWRTCSAWRTWSLWFWWWIQYGGKNSWYHKASRSVANSVKWQWQIFFFSYTPLQFLGTLLWC